VPNFARGTPSAKAAETQVTLIAATDTKVDITINQHWEYSKLIEDIASTQMIDSYRMAYTDDAGYSLAKLVDMYLHNRAGAWQGGTAVTFEADNSYADSDFGGAAVIGGNGSTTFNGDTDNATDLTDEGLRTVMLGLDNADVPQSERTLVIPPVTKKDMLAISKYVEMAFVGEGGSSNPIRSGLVGDVYGVPVFVSTNGPTDVAGSQDARCALYFHRSALALATQIDIRVQTQYKQEYLGDLFTADTLFGAIELRNDAGYCIAVPAT
jgi:hypothetical protein